MERRLRSPINASELRWRCQSIHRSSEVKIAQTNTHVLQKLLTVDDASSSLYLLLEFVLALAVETTAMIAAKVNPALNYQLGKSMKFRRLH